jgi:hypothetical protein
MGRECVSPLHVRTLSATDGSLAFLSQSGRQNFNSEPVDRREVVETCSCGTSKMARAASAPLASTQSGNSMGLL